jgi:regulator of replication initiation timing
MFNNNKKKIHALQDELYIARLENASLRSRLAKATVKEAVKKTTKSVGKTTKKEVK